MLLLWYPALPIVNYGYLDGPSWGGRLGGSIERWARAVLLVDGPGVVFLAVGPEAGDFEEHGEEGEDAGGTLLV